MIGLKYLRTKLCYSGEQLADMLECNKSMISRWEAGKTKISDKYKLKLSEEFKCRPELLGKEINELEKYELEQAALKYMFGRSCIVAGEVQDNIRIQWSERVNRIASQLENAPDLLVPVQKWIDIAQRDRAMTNILLAAMEKYFKDEINDRETYEVTDYENNMIALDDPYVSIICSTLTAALGKRK